MRYLFLPILSLVIIYLVLFVSCKKEDIVEESKQSPEIINYCFDTDLNSGLMFQDFEPKDSILSEWRTFEIGNVLRVKPVSDKIIEVANFAPIDLYDATIMMVIKSTNDTLKLFNVARIRAHAVQRVEYPFVSGDAYMFNGNQNQIIDLSSYSDLGIKKEEVEFYFDGENETLLKLKSLSKLNWKIRFEDRNPDNDISKFARLDVWPIDARRYTAYMINMGAMFTWKQFKVDFLTEPQSFGNGDFFSLQDKIEVYQDLINTKRYDVGVTRKTGMGGGANFALGQGQLYKFIHKGTTKVGAHETGHMLGFGHNSSMTYPKKLPDGTKYGIEVNVSSLIKKAKEANVYPVTFENYYYPSDFDEKITTNLPYPY